MTSYHTYNKSQTYRSLPDPRRSSPNYFSRHTPHHSPLTNPALATWAVLLFLKSAKHSCLRAFALPVPSACDPADPDLFIDNFLWHFKLYSIPTRARIPTITTTPLLFNNALCSLSLRIVLTTALCCIVYLFIYWLDAEHGPPGAVVPSVCVPPYT